MKKLSARLLSFFRWPAKLLIKTRLVPAADEARQLDSNKPIIYLLKTESGSDMLALEQATRKAGLPSPFSTLEIAGKTFNRCLAIDKAAKPFRSPDNVKQSDAQSVFNELFEIQKATADLDVQIVPASVFWGRSPEQTLETNEKLFWGAVTSPNWLTKLFVVTFSGRNTFVVLSPFVSSKSMVEQRGDAKNISHKMMRVARVHFRRKQNAVLGPTQFNRQQLLFRTFAADAMKQAIQDEMKSSNCSKEQAKRRALKYFNEIAADFRPGMIGLFDWALTLLWNKIYSGIKVQNADQLQELAQKGHEIVYVPCHRSHIDYLLLTYVIYHQGLMTPHIAAGVNLNFWPAGPVLRRAGAFFIRRTFRGNRLYTAVFREYLDQLFNLGYPVKYCCEGGRSRTGRLLAPKTGMLAMTVQSVMRGVERPVSFVPVYIGYEHVMEVASYLKELRGNNKQKESMGQVFSAIKNLKNFGLGYVSFGQPISLNQFFNSQYPDWAQDIGKTDAKPTWLNPAVNELASRVQVGINQAAAVNPVALVAMCLLAADHRALTRSELLKQLSFYLSLLKALPYNKLVYVPDEDAEQVLAAALAHNKFEVMQDGMGEVIKLDESAAIAMTYYRNNIKHLFILPGLVAAKLAGSGSERKQTHQFVEQLYPILQSEWFIEVDDLAEYVEQIISFYKAGNFVQQKGRKLVATDLESTEYFSLALLAKSVQDTLQRYAVVLSIIEQKSAISRSDLERQSQALAKRLAAVHGINAPEFFDKKVIATKVAAMRDKQLITTDEQGMLLHSESSQSLMHQVLELVDFEVRQTITSVD